jgi:hypothetical protein
VVADAPVNVYVDGGRSGANEDGTQEHPYDTIKEGEGYARSSPDGGIVYIKQADGNWKYYDYFPSVDSGGQGTLLPRITLYALLAVLALGLILVGWQLRRRAYQLRG